MSTNSATRLSLVAILSALFVVCLMPSQVAAQDTATITGVVTDQSGAVVPNVKVILRNPQTGVTYETTTSASGSYTFSLVKPGPGYTIQFTGTGFKDVVISGLYMNVDNTRVQNAQLTIGSTSETVEVSAASENVTLNTTDASVGNNFQVEFMNNLPVQDRATPAALFVQQPGVTLDGAVTGARVDQSRVTVDGLDVNDYATGEFGDIVGNAPVDSVQEFRGVAAGDLSSAAGGGGGQYELVTKSGTNSFHGALVEYYRSRGLEANDWFNNNTGVARPPLVRNQFGGNVGGPIIRNKLFFFFDYDGRRDSRSILVERTVPMDSFRNGILQYIDSSNNVAQLNSAQVAGLDPLGFGFNADLLSLFDARYPHANDLSGAKGDLLNTAGFRFNAPQPLSQNTYVTRVDYNFSDKLKFFGKTSITRENRTYASEWFPGDPLTSPFFDKSYNWVVGGDWTISNTKINQFSYGEVYENFNFPITFNPTGATQFLTMGGDGSGGSILSGPYRQAINQQGRTYPIPIVRDDFSWDKGKHSLRFGGTFKWLSPGGYTILDYDAPTIGLGGAMSSLDSSQEPADLCPTSSPTCGFASQLYDPAFALALAPYSTVSSTFNYDAQGNVLPQATGSRNDYRYYETELYFGDTWKVTPKFTVSYGVRWVNYSVPYEVHGLESIQNTNFDDYFYGARVPQSAAGQAGDDAVPLISYSLGGKANHAPGYFKPQYKNFGPRLAFAYAVNPKTVFNAGAGIIYDQTVVNAVQYQQSQYSYLFQSSATEILGDLTSAPRFSGLSTPPPPPTAPAITKPFLPFVDTSGGSPVPFGLANGGAFNEIIDPNLKTPYSITYNLGMQHEFGKGLILRLNYSGRQGRRLLAQIDSNQLIDFPDALSGQMMSTAFANLSQQLRSGQTVTAQPWFEDVLFPIGPPGQNTAILGNSFLAPVAARGDFADFMQALSLFGFLPSNVGMASQFSENTFYTNKGFSSYNGLLATLHKNFGFGLQFDLNYTWSHSIDNVSLTANQQAFGGYGFICDALRLRECRGNSDFDVTHYFNGNFIYDLPFGKGRALGGSSPTWLNEIIGGWSISGLPNWHSGLPYFAQGNAFVAGYSNNAPSLLVGPISDMHIHLNGGNGQALYGFANPNQANADYTGPIGFTIGSRNNLRGPGYFSMDMGIGKSLPLGTERMALKLRMDAFNVFNHPNFQTPCVDITNATCLFGTISSSMGTGVGNADDPYRVVQLSVRLEF